VNACMRVTSALDQADERAAKDVAAVGRAEAALGGSMKEKVSKLEAELQVQAQAQPYVAAGGSVGQD
jgi:hypothetical protein